MKRAAIAALLVLTACGRTEVRAIRVQAHADRTEAKDPPDAGMGTPDLGPADVGVEKTECDLGEQRVFIDVEGPQGQFGGLAIVLEIEPLVLESLNPKGPGLFIVSIPEGLSPPLFIGQEVQFDLEVDRPFWTNATLILQEPLFGSGPLLFAIWAGDRPITRSFSNIFVQYTEDDCAPAMLSDCGDVVSQTLNIRIDDMSAEVFAGEERFLEGFRVRNGASQRFTEPPSCPDVPGGWWSGVVIPAPRPPG